MTKPCDFSQGFVEYPQGDSKFRGISKENVTEREEAAHNPAQSGPSPHSLDPDLARILDAWPTLPAHIKAAVLAVVATNDATPSVG
jgi:hypothetical protein